LLVTSTEPGHIILWGVPELTEIQSYQSDNISFGPFVGFATTPDLSLAAYGLWDGQIRVIDLRDGSERWTRKAVKDYVTALAFSPDGQTLASAGGPAESDIRLWDVATGKEEGPRLEDHKNWVGSLVFFLDGNTLASGSGDQTIRIWDVAKRKCLDVLHGHEDEVWKLALLPDGKTLVSACKDGTVCLWDTSVEHKKLPYIIIKDVQAWCFTPDSRSVLTLNPDDGQVTQREGDNFQETKPLLDIGNNFLGGVFSGDGHYLATGSANGVISIWDLSKKTLRQSLKGEPGEIVPVRFFAKGRKLLTKRWLIPDVRIHTWDLATEREQYSWIAPPRPALQGLEYRQPMEISPDSTYALVFGWKYQFLYADLINGIEKTLNIEPIGAVSGAAFSSEGNFFAVSSHLSKVQVWDTETWQEQARLGGYMQGLFSVTFSPDGYRLVSGGDKHEALRFWDTRSWRDVLTLTSDQADFWDTRFSPDGNTIGSLNINGTLYIWHVPSMETINAIEAKQESQRSFP